MSHPRNNSSMAGKRAGSSVPAGEFNRYRVYPVHTRFESVEWFVTDAESLDTSGLPLVVRQEPTFEAAVSGL